MYSRLGFVIALLALLVGAYWWLTAPVREVRALAEAGDVSKLTDVVLRVAKSAHEEPPSRGWLTDEEPATLARYELSDLLNGDESGHRVVESKLKSARDTAESPGERRVIEDALTAINFGDAKAARTHLWTEVLARVGQIMPLEERISRTRNQMSYPTNSPPSDEEVMALLEGEIPRAEIYEPERFPAIEDREVDMFLKRESTVPTFAGLTRDEIALLQQSVKVVGIVVRSTYQYDYYIGCPGTAYRKRSDFYRVDLNTGSVTAERLVGDRPPEEAFAPVGERCDRTGSAPDEEGVLVLSEM